MARWLSWLERRPVTAEVVGSNPIRVVCMKHFVTGYFTGMPEIQKRDTAGMLTIFNSVGSGVQILCPMLYNVLIQPDGRTWPLRVFGMCYIGAAALFLLLMGGGRGLALRPKEG